MKQNINKFSIIAFCIFLLTCFTALAESPEEKGLQLAIEVDKRDEGFQDTTSQMKMKLRNAQGEESIREFHSKTLEVLDDGSQNNNIPLKSSKFFTITNSPAFLKRPPGMMEEIRVVPNPYNIAGRDMQYGVSAPDRLMFLNIPGECTIRIFTERGDLLKTIQHTDGSGDEAWNSITSSRQIVTSGLYIAHFETPKGESAIRKFLIVR